MTLCGADGSQPKLHRRPRNLACDAVDGEVRKLLEPFHGRSGLGTVASVHGQLGLVAKIVERLLEPARGSVGFGGL